MAFLSPGEPVTAQHWTDLWTEADARLAKLYSNLPPCLWGLSGAPRFSFNHVRRFYFWSDALPVGYGDTAFPYAAWKTVAQVFFGKQTVSGVLRNGTDPWVRNYTHDPFTNLVALLDLDDPDSFGLSRPATNDEYLVARLRPLTGPEQTASQNALWGGSVLGGDPADALRYSLEHHKKAFDTGSGSKDYHVYVSNIGNNEVERRHRWHPIDVYIGETYDADNPLEWPAAYNKYQFIRFNNLQQVTAVVELEAFPGADVFTLSIPPMRCKCVRQTAEGGGYYVSPLQYFHTMLPQDPWWVGLTLGATGALLQTGDPTVDVHGDVRQLDEGLNHVGTDPLKVAQLLTQVDPQVFASYFGMNEGRSTLTPVLFRGANLWDASGIYNTGAYAAGPKERPTPSGGYFGAVGSDATILGDLIVHKGTMVVARVVDATTIWRQSFEFQGFGSLIADLAAVGILVTQPKLGDPLRSTLSPAGEGLGGNLIGLSSNFVLALRGTAGVSVGPIDWDTPALQGMPIGTSEVAAVDLTADWVTFTFVGPGYPAIVDSDYTTGTDSVTVTNRTRSQSTATPAGFNLFDTVADLKAALAALAGDAVPVLTEVKMTAFGPLVHTDQILELDYPTPLLTSSQQPIFTLVAPDLTHDYWTYRRSEFQPLAKDSAGGVYQFPFFGGPIDPGFGWPRIASGSLVAIHWPRLWRRWINTRFVKHDPATWPMWYPGDDATPPYEWYSVEDPYVKSYYESKPVKDSVLIVLNGSKSVRVRTKTGISMLGPWTRFFDIYTRMGPWAANEVLRYSWPYIFNRGPVQTATEDYSVGSPRLKTWLDEALGVDFAAGGSNFDLRGISQNQLHIEVEHYNACLSLVSAVVGANTCECQPLIQEPLRQFYVGNNVGADVAGFVGRGLGALNLRPRNQWIAWDAVENPDAQAKMEAAGVEVLTGADLPGDLADFMAANAALSDGLGTVNELEEMPLYDVWGGGLFQTPLSYDAFQTAIDNYRWVTIDEGPGRTGAKAYHAKLGFPLVMEELAVPVDIVVTDASWSTLDTYDIVTPDAAAPSDVPPGVDKIARAGGFVNNEDGVWLINVLPQEGGITGTVAPRLRASADNDTESVSISTGYSSVDNMDMTFTVTLRYYLIKADWGRVGERLYQVLQDPAGVSSYACPVPPTRFSQVNNGLGGRNLFYFVRRIGGSPVRVVLWPRNYIGYEADFDDEVLKALAPSGSTGHIPRVGHDDLEDDGPTVIDLPRVDDDPDGALLEEFTVDTEMENCEMQLYKEARPLTEP